MTTLFISDLHLTPSRPDITECFVTFMRTEATKADALYVLGDLFEFWIGDDDNTPFADQIRAEFKALTDAGVPTFFIQGNRDFLLGKRFCKETGMTLLDDVCTIDLYGQKAVILHGDTLCIDDVKYQEFRKPFTSHGYNGCLTVFLGSLRRKLSQKFNPIFVMIK